ncbi:MAG: glycosyltransferase [Planctomycetota bacterium]
MSETNDSKSAERAEPKAIDVSAVIPVSDERIDFQEIVREYGREFRRRGVACEFIFVLDGPLERLFDEIARFAKRRQPADPIVKIVKFNQSFGESIALSAGFKVADGAVVISLPPFIQIEPRDIHHVLDAVAAGADVVICWRYPRVDPIINCFQSWVFNLLMQALTGVPVHDLNCLVRAMRRRVFEDVTVQGDMYRFLPVLAHRAGYAVAEVKVRHVKEPGRWGFFGIGVYIRRVLDVAALLFLTKFTRKPLRFFGLLGGIETLLGMAICSWLVIQFAQGGDQTELRNRAALILGVLLIVLGVQTFFIGFVAEIIIFTQARNLKDYKVDRYEGGDPHGGRGHVLAHPAALPAGDGRDVARDEDGKVGRDKDKDKDEDKAKRDKARTKVAKIDKARIEVESQTRAGGKGV